MIVVFVENEKAKLADELERKIKYHSSDVSLHDIPLQQLKESSVIDLLILSIHISFVSEWGNHFTAVNVFKHATGQYVLLSSEDKNYSDFTRVSQTIANAYEGQLEEKVHDRIEDICGIIRLKTELKQAEIAEKVEHFYQPSFTRVSIEHVYFDI